MRVLKLYYLLFFVKNGYFGVLLHNLGHFLTSQINKIININNILEKILGLYKNNYNCVLLVNRP